MCNKIFKFNLTNVSFKRLTKQMHILFFIPHSIERKWKNKIEKKQGKGNNKWNLPKNAFKFLKKNVYEIIEFNMEIF